MEKYDFEKVTRFLDLSGYSNTGIANRILSKIKKSKNITTELLLDIITSEDFPYISKELAENNKEDALYTMEYYIWWKSLTTIEKKKIRFQRFEKLKNKNGVVQLDKNNPIHREWFENDEDYNV